MLLAIGTNTVSMSLDRYPITHEELTLLELINNVCTWIFIGEMLLKIAGLGIVTYITDAVNLFDAFVVIVSIIELAMACLLYTSPSPRDLSTSRMPSSA